MYWLRSSGRSLGADLQQRAPLFAARATEVSLSFLTHVSVRIGGLPLELHTEDPLLGVAVDCTESPCRTDAQANHH